MSDYLKISRSMTITGFIIFILGMLTFTPEIFFSGIVVMVVSGTQGIQQLEVARIQETTVVAPPPPTETQHFYAW